MTSVGKGPGAPYTFTTMWTFTGGSDGGTPLAGLVEGIDGNFYGTTTAGGASPMKSGRPGSIRFTDGQGNPVKGIKVTLDPEGKDLR